MPGTTLKSRLEIVENTKMFSPQLLDQLGKWIEAAPQDELHRTNPIRVGSRLNVSQAEALELLLHATHAGIFDFSWGVLCPACASFITTPAGLKSLGQDQWCSFCRMPAKGLLDDNVEVTFTVSPVVRRIRFHDPGSLDYSKDGLGVFFSRSIRADSMLHQLLREQQLLADRIPVDAPRTFRLKLNPGRYSLLFPHSHAVFHFSAIEGPGPNEIGVELLDGSCLGQIRSVAAGEITLRLLNRSKHPEGLLVLPDPVPPPEARCADMKVPPAPLMPFLTGKRLLSSQSFRTLFRTESIPAEGGLELRNLTILFSDLKGSTEMYERIGDFRAYDLVRRHFYGLFEAVAKQGGAVVKTIGDAIMASFDEPGMALKAAMAMNLKVRKVGHGEDLKLKLGLHAGPCIAVELNERLDFFGRTVNIAARVQGVAEADQIVCTEEVLNTPGIDQWVRDTGLEMNRDEVQLKGIANRIPIVRLRMV